MSEKGPFRNDHLTDGSWLNHQYIIRSKDGNFPHLPDVAASATGTKVVLHRDSGAASQTIQAATWTVITGWSVLSGDSGMLDGNTIKIPETGKYIIGITAAIEDNGSAALYGTKIMKNGTTDLVVVSSNAGTTLQFHPKSCYREVSLAADDYLEAAIYSSTAGDMVRVANSHPLFYVWRSDG